MVVQACARECELSAGRTPAQKLCESNTRKHHTSVFLPPLYTCQPSVIHKRIGLLGPGQVLAQRVATPPLGTPPAPCPACARPCLLGRGRGRAREPAAGRTPHPLLCTHLRPRAGPSTLASHNSATKPRCAALARPPWGGDDQGAMAGGPGGLLQELRDMEDPSWWVTGREAAGEPGAPRARRLPWPRAPAPAARACRPARPARTQSLPQHTPPLPRAQRPQPLWPQRERLWGGGVGGGAGGRPGRADAGDEGAPARAAPPPKRQPRRAQPRRCSGPAPIRMSTDLGS